ncbi:MAG TPA: GNAT family N-acetyltransferase [Caulobacteraceae bacterium]
MTKTTIRRAKAADARALADLGARTFAAAFGHLYPPEDLAAFIADTHTADKAAVELADPEIAAWLAERGGVAVGYALAGPCALPHPEVTPACAELKRIYVDADLQGDGVGQALIEAALDWLERRGSPRLWIGVWSENHGAQRFYERKGFHKVGEYEFRVGGSIDREFIMSRG